MVDQALRDHQYVLPGLQTLLMNYLCDEHVYLEGLAGELLIDILWHDSVKNSLYSTLEFQL